MTDRHAPGDPSPVGVGSMVAALIDNHALRHGKRAITQTVDLPFIAKQGALDSN